MVHLTKTTAAASRPPLTNPNRPDLETRNPPWWTSKATPKLLYWWKTNNTHWIHEASAVWDINSSPLWIMSSIRLCLERTSFGSGGTWWTLQQAPRQVSPSPSCNAGRSRSTSHSSVTLCSSFTNLCFYICSRQSHHESPGEALKGSHVTADHLGGPKVAPSKRLRKYVGRDQRWKDRGLQSKDS